MESAESDVGYFEVNAVFSVEAKGAIGEEYMNWSRL